MRTIYLTRHGKPIMPSGVSAGSRICLGRMDLPLSPLGKYHAKKLGEYFRKREATAVFSSPLTRCLQTAEGLISGTGKSGNTTGDIKVEADLAEIDVGEWDGLTFSEIKKKYPELYARRKDGFDEYAPPGGETFAAALERVKPAFEKIIADTNGDIVVSAHAGVNRLLLCTYTGTPLEKCFDFPQPYGCINILKVGAGVENSVDVNMKNILNIEIITDADSKNSGSISSISVEAIGILPGGYPDDDECALMMKGAGVPEHIIEHCTAVADYVSELTVALKGRGHALNLPLIRAAALLHDIARLSPHHAKAGAKMLRMDGHMEIADIVRVHNDISAPDAVTPILDEKTLLYYADKRMLENRKVTLEERFQTSKAKCDSSKAFAANQRRYKAAKEIEALIMKEGVSV